MAMWTRVAFRITELEIDSDHRRSIEGQAESGDLLSRMDGTVGCTHIVSPTFQWFEY